MADGTITLETKADEKGVKVGMKEIEASVKRMSSSVEKSLGKRLRSPSEAAGFPFQTE